MNNNLTKARLLFNVAHITKEDCFELINLTKNNNDVTMQGYYAAGIMISSKYTINPFKITKTFNEGKNLFEDLISENFDEIELRYLRYSIQLNTPKFVGYYKNIEMDRIILIDYIKQQPNSDLTAHMMVFLKNTSDSILSMI